MASYKLGEDETTRSADELDVPIVEEDRDCSISSRASSLCRHKGTAKLVSIAFVGKPQLVNMASCDGSTSLRTIRANCSEEGQHCLTSLYPILSTTIPSSISTDILY